jgi:hypothetical protein
MTTNPLRLVEFPYQITQEAIKDGKTVEYIVALVDRWENAVPMARDIASRCQAFRICVWEQRRQDCLLVWSSDAPDA